VCVFVYAFVLSHDSMYLCLYRYRYKYIELLMDTYLCDSMYLCLYRYKYKYIELLIEKNTYLCVRLNVSGWVSMSRYIGIKRCICICLYVRNYVYVY
jgi:hypothetical protein